MDMDQIAREIAYSDGYDAGKRALAESFIELLEDLKEDPVSDWHCGYFAAYDDVILMLKREAGLDETNP